MKAFSILVCSLMCPVAIAGAGQAAEPAPLAFGEVFNGLIFAVRDNAQVLEIDLGKNDEQGRLADLYPLAVANDFPPRWKIGFGALVMTNSNLELGPPFGPRDRDIKTTSVSVEVGDSAFLVLSGFGGGPWSDGYRDNNLICFVYEEMVRFVNDRDHVHDDKG